MTGLTGRYNKVIKNHKILHFIMNSHKTNNSKIKKSDKLHIKLKLF